MYLLEGWLSSIVSGRADCLRLKYRYRRWEWLQNNAQRCEITLRSRTICLKFKFCVCWPISVYTEPGFSGQVYRLKPPSRGRLSPTDTPPFGGGYYPRGAVPVGAPARYGKVKDLTHCLTQLLKYYFLYWSDEYKYIGDISVNSTTEKIFTEVRVLRVSLFAIIPKRERRSSRHRNKGSHHRSHRTCRDIHRPSSFFSRPRSACRARLWKEFWKLLKDMTCLSWLNCKFNELE